MPWKNKVQAQRKLLLGVDVGGTKTAVVLAQTPSVVLWRREFATTPQHGPEHAIASIVSLAREGCKALAALPACIGVSCGGPLDHVRGIIQSPPNLPTWKDVPIRDILERELHAACTVENDANAGAIAEHRHGAGSGTRHMVFLTMGTGLGAGLILNGSLYRGASAMAGEIGHVGLTEEGPVGHGKAGSVEGWASGAGLAQHAVEAVRLAVRQGETTTLSSCLPQLTARHVGQALAAGDPVARRIVEYTGARLGQAMAILVDVLNPERIVVGGLAMRLGEALLDPARQQMRLLSLQASAEACSVVSASLGEQIGDVAALCVAQGKF